MSEPKAPYYARMGRNDFHWETSCSRNEYPDRGWVKMDFEPNRIPCEECKGK